MSRDDPTNLVLSEMERTRSTQLASGETVPLHSHVSPEAGRVLRAAVSAARPAVGCEVGLAFGMSTLYILDAMAGAGRGRLLGMDPAQMDRTWRGGGLHNVRRAGFSERYEFFEEPSQQVLPRLAAAGTRLQFGFIDGWHTFDHTLVDFFYIDRMMDVGGVVVLDDLGYPALRRLGHFIVANRAYRVLDLEERVVPTSLRHRAKRALQRALRPLVRDDMTPLPDEARAAVDRAQLIALRKEADDRRHFDHFVPF